MSELAFAELQTQIESLPFYQILTLQNTLNRLVEKEKNKGSDEYIAQGLSWLDEISGSVHREIDYKKEREEWRDERY